MLATKVCQVSDGVQAVASSLGVGDDAPWNVRGVVVTRNPVPAAYVRPAPPFPFVTLTQLRQFASRPGGDGLGR